ncbi:MAG: glutamine synthetase [Clostridiales bacterium]|nr:glutamine synthetase [Clostridiales bacterium]
MDSKKMLYKISPEDNGKDSVRSILEKHPEVEFVSLVGVDVWGYSTDEKIPVKLFIEDFDQMMKNGVQTDGSSVMLPKIAELNNAKVDIIPDKDVNWYVDYNYGNISEETGLPVGTLRIPSLLVHNETLEVGSRVILKKAIKEFKKELVQLISDNDYICTYLGINSADDIEEIVLTSATELEFWVKTPDDIADREQLATSQTLKEQYWKRTVGPVRTALEKALKVLDCYGFEVEMGHKEVGGVKAKLVGTGSFDHVMEQLEIDWKYAEALQAADNEAQVKNIVKDIFRYNGLDVTFQAKPIELAAGNGEHTHLGVAANLKDGRKINLFTSLDKNQFMTPIGYGGLMGLLKNYEIVNPFISSTNDALNRLKPGFEAPVCIVTSLGHDPSTPSRNRTVLAGLVRELGNPYSTRFELRSPNPKSNTYLVIATAYMAMLDGIRAVLEAGKTPEELEKEISKEYGEEGFYLERDRVYRSEKNVFDEYTPAERNKLFGRAPETVWENISALDANPEKLQVLYRGDVFNDLTIASYKEAMIDMWQTELSVRIIHEYQDIVKECVKIQGEEETDLDAVNWKEVRDLKAYLMKDSIEKKSLSTRIRKALTDKDYPLASLLQVEMHNKIEELIEKYSEYKKNIF